jgi:hypothetical protein
MFTGDETPAVSLRFEPMSKEGNMPQIIVTADQPGDGSDRPMMLTERVSVQDFESDHFRAQLVERLGWAVGDADAIDQRRKFAVPNEPVAAENQPAIR